MVVGGKMNAQRVRQESWSHRAVTSSLGSHTFSVVFWTSASLDASPKVDAVE